MVLSFRVGEAEGNVLFLFRGGFYCFLYARVPVLNVDDSNFLFLFPHKCKMVSRKQSLKREAGGTGTDAESVAFCSQTLFLMRRPT